MENHKSPPPFGGDSAVVLLWRRQPHAVQRGLPRVVGEALEQVADVHNQLVGRGGNLQAQSRNTGLAKV